MFIYLIVNRETGKYYVGQHKGDNLKKYLQQKFHHAQRGISSQSRLYHSMRAHPDPLVWSIHALRAGIQTRTELDETERDFITFLKAQDPEYGYNICRGGEGFTGPHSKASRKKTSESLKKAWKVPEIRKRITGNRRGKTHDRGCLIPHEARVRGGRTGGSVKSEAKTKHCKVIARLGGLVGGQATNATTGGRKGNGGRASILKMTTAMRIVAGLKGGKATANKPGFLAEIGRIARCKHWQIDCGKLCICGKHIAM